MFEIFNDKIHAASGHWGNTALCAEFFHFVLFWTSGPILFQKGIHPIAVCIFVFGWLLGLIGGACAIVGLFKDEKKWPSVLGLVLFPFSIFVAV
jgi:hypothetical protein